MCKVTIPIRHDIWINTTKLQLSSVDIQWFENAVTSVDVIKDLFSKPTNKHNYLLPSSCYRRHCIRNIPYSQALRIQRIWFSHQRTVTTPSQYVQSCIKKATKKAKSKPGTESWTYKPHQTSSNRYHNWIITWSLTSGRYISKEFAHSSKY